MIKYSLFALFLWLGVAMLSALAEYAWIGSTEAAAITKLWSGWGIFGTITGVIAVGATLLFGARGFRLATLGAGVVVLIALRDIMLFNYPTIFYGPYEIVRWIILLIMLCIFIIPIMMSLISQGGNPS